MELKNIIQVILSNSDLILCEKIISTDYIKLVVDTKEGVTLKQISDLTKTIKNNQNIADIYPDGIRLEVTSPGIDCPLTHDFHFIRNIGRAVRINHQTSDVYNPFEGEIVKFKNNTITIENKKQFVAFNLSEIINCHLIFQKTSEE